MGMVPPPLARPPREFIQQDNEPISYSVDGILLCGYDELIESRAGKVTWQCEIDEYCRRVLAQHWPNVKRYEDIRVLSRPLNEKLQVMVSK